MAEKGRPGVMFYFEMRPCLKRLTPEEKGRLFECVLDYAQYGAVPELEGALGVAWDFLQPRIDHDAERYEEIAESRRSAARKRWDKQEQAQQTAATECTEMQPDANASGALQTMPTTNTNTKTKTTANSSPYSVSVSTPAAGKAGQISPDRERLAEELTFEDMRQRKLKLLSGMMSSG